MMVVNDCKAKENANDDDALIVFNHDVPTTSTQKCLFACFYETLGVVSSKSHNCDKILPFFLNDFSN